MEDSDNGEDQDSDTQKLAPGVKEQAEQENALPGEGRKLGDRDHGHPQFQRGVGRLLLQGVSRLVCCNPNGSHRSAVEIFGGKE